MKPADPARDYLPSDAQLTPTIDPDLGRLEDVDAVDEDTARDVLHAIREREIDKLAEPDDPKAVAVRQNGERAELPQLALPGFGERYGPEHEHGACGQPMPMVCEGCGKPKEIGRTCRRSRCPRCGAAWVQERASSMNANLGAVRAVMDSNTDEDVVYHHSVLMAPEDWLLDRDDALDATFRMIGEMLDAVDHEGYVLYHPYSGSGYRDDEGEGDDRGAWRDRLFADREWSDVRNELYHRPHFHIISVGEFLPGQDFTRELYNETGWVWERIVDSSTDNAVSIYDDEALARAGTYSWSHIGLEIDAGEDGSTQAQFRRYGSLLHNPDITPSDKFEQKHDVLTKKAAATTLGVPLADSFCLEETEGRTHGYQWGGTDSIRSQHADGSADRDVDETEAAIDQATTILETIEDAGDGPIELPADANLPDLPIQADLEGDLTTPESLAREELEAVAHEILEEGSPRELTECQGRLVHLLEARDRLLSDDEWIEDAPHADEAQATLDEWRGREDELIRWGPEVD